MFVFLLCVVASTPSSGSASSPAPISARVWSAQAEEENGNSPARRLIRRDSLRDLVRRPGAGQRRMVPPQGSPSAEPTPTVSPSTAPPGTPGAPPTAAPPVNKPPANNDINFEERAKKGKFSFDFNKAEIIDVVKAISDMTRKNFIIPEKLKSQRVTILSPTKITAGEAYQVFLAALEVNGVTVVRSGKFYKLVEAKESVKEPIPTCVGPDDKNCPRYSEQMVTLILPMQHIDAQQLQNVIKPLLSKESEMQVFQPTNSLIVSEFAHNLTRVRHIIEALDVPGFQDELQLVQIQYATASDIADKLTQIFEVQRGGTASTRPGQAPRPGRPMEQAKGAGTDEAEVQISKIIPDDRTNQLIIKANRRSFDAIRKLIAKLDVPVSDAEAGKVHVYYLENASAEDLASTLSSLAQGQPNRSQPTRPRGVQPAGAQGQQGQESAVLFEGEVKITADKATNALVIVASGRDYAALRRIIEMLDRPRRQVYIEAAVLEVDVSNNVDYGLNWHIPGRIGKNDVPSGGALGGAKGAIQSGPWSSGGISPTLAPLSPQSLIAIAQGAVVGIIGKGQKVKIGDQSVTLPAFGVLLRWLETSHKAQLLSTPHILTTDNQEASIEVGQKIPFQRGTAIPNLGNLGALATGAAAGAAGGTNAASLQSLGGFGNLFSQVDRVDVSLKLTLTPQINERGKIKLDIDQEFEDVTSRDPTTGVFETANRAAKTTVVVDDQQTIVIGGLIRDRVRETENKLPILGDLPLIGWLFKSTTKDVEKLNLLLVLTPYVVREPQDFQDIFERKMHEYEEFAADYYGSSKEYRAYIDYSKKSGPLAHIIQRLQTESNKIENGGTGDGSEIIIEPTTPPEEEQQGIPVPGESSDQSEATPNESEPAPPPEAPSQEAPDEGGNVAPEE